MPSGLRVLGVTSMMLLAMPITLPAAPAVSTGRKDSLEQGFAQPPPAARPRVWWHWMNGNITKEGIKADLEWMHRIGIGGIQNFDASLGTPKVVDERLEFMTPQWKSAFGYAVQSADRMGLEMAIASSPGWSESGGPWVGPAQAMKKLVWSETRIEGAKTDGIVLPKPPSVSGPFQRQRRMPLFGADPNAPPPPDYYEDCAVIAYRVPAADVPLSDLSPVISSSGGSVDPAKLWDQDGATSVSIPSKSPDAAAWIQYQFPKPQVIRGVRFGIEHRGLPVFLGGLPEQAQLQASDDGVEFRTLRSIPLNRPGMAQDPGEVTLAIPSTTARYFRVALTMGKALADRPDVDFGILGIPNAAPPAGFAVTEFSLLAAAVVERFEDKAGFAIGSDLNASATPEAGADAVIARSDVLDLTGKLMSDGRLQWNAPPGRWVVLRLGYSLTGAKNSPASAEATGLEVDKLDRDAVADYLHHYLDLYESAIRTKPCLCCFDGPPTRTK